MAPAPSTTSIKMPVLTRTALIKVGALISRMRALTTEQVSAWLRAQISNGVELEQRVVLPDIRARCVLLPDSVLTDYGDRLVALIEHGYQDGALVCVTVKQLRKVMVPVGEAKAAIGDPRPPAPGTPTTLTGKFAALENAREIREAVAKAVAKAIPAAPPPPTQAPIVHRVEVMAAGPSPSPREVARRMRKRFEPLDHDNRGAQMVRMELAKRRLVHSEVAARLGIPPRTFSDFINGRQVPDIRAAVAMRDHLGIPLESWSEAA